MSQQSSPTPPVAARRASTSDDGARSPARTASADAAPSGTPATEEDSSARPDTEPRAATLLAGAAEPPAAPVKPPAREVIRLPLYYRSYTSRAPLDRYVFDREYAERLSSGDAEIERHFTRYFGDLLLIKLRARLRSPELAEDARQETLMRVLTALRTKKSIEYPERLGAFVNSVCENVLAEFFRAEGRFRQTPEHADFPDHRTNIESEFISEERQALIQNAMTKLAAGDRKLLRAIFFDERDKDDVAHEFGITRDYLRVRVHRALGRLRDALRKASPGHSTAAAGA